MNNIFDAWKKFRRGKIHKIDVMNFEMHLEDNLFCLFEDLRYFNYKHSSYRHFEVFDNKKRDIYKAEIRDRIVHQIIFDFLSSIFESEFISDSYASRKGKGQYKAINTFRYFLKLTHFKSRSTYILKCDVKKYFESIDRNILLELIRKKVKCEKIFEIIRQIVGSFANMSNSKGIPLGNITSQIFANIYLHTLDIHIKNYLKCNYYIRYNDDFVIITNSKERLVNIRNDIISFVKDRLSLEIPHEKTCIRKACWGMDYLGFTIFPNFILLRNKTKNKIFNNLDESNKSSYFGILKYCNSFNLKQKIVSLLATSQKGNI